MIKIAETQAKDVQHRPDGDASTRATASIAGHVARVDPAAQNGTVTVDVALDGALPKGARPDLTVDGTIELERLADVLYVGRPAQGQAESLVGLFRLDEGRQRGHAGEGQARPQLGQHHRGRRGSRRSGDQVILSDTSAWDAYDRIRLN